MSFAKLSQGDRVSFAHNGRRLRGVVGDFIPMKERGEALLVPVLRPRCVNRVNADGSTSKKVRWIARTELRKLP